MGENIIPRHIAIIMDGNGRWAAKRSLPVKLGHKAGAETLRKITDEAIKIGVSYLTVFAFSTENWKRPKQEVDSLMSLMNSYLDEYTKDAEKKNTKVRVLGDIRKLSRELIDKIENLQKITENKTGLCLNIAINYGGRDEIVRAAVKIAERIKKGEIVTEDIKEDTFGAYLDTAYAPEPDLLIRTSGEMRISNFMLWQLAYTEFYFTDKLWPDFDKSDLTEAIASFNEKKRRFGGRKIL